MTQLICSETHAVSRLRGNSWSKGFKAYTNYRGEIDSLYGFSNVLRFGFN